MTSFRETQRFNQWWIQLINLSALVVLGVFMFRWYVQGKAVDKVGPDDVQGQLVVSILLILCFALIYLFCLTSKIDEKGIHYKFFPFHFGSKKISWYDIQECYIRTYNPTGEYGGWGVKKVPTKNSKGYNVKGTIGIQLVLKSGQKVLLGTQRPKEAKEVIHRYFKNRK